MKFLCFLFISAPFKLHPLACRFSLFALVTRYSRLLLGQTQQKLNLYYDVECSYLHRIYKAEPVANAANGSADVCSFPHTYQYALLLRKNIQSSSSDCKLFSSGRGD